MDFEVERMDPLFASELLYEEFTARHQRIRCQERRSFFIQRQSFLGIDAGSTTTKAALVGEDGTLLYSFYTTTTEILWYYHHAIKDIYDQTSGRCRDRSFLFHRIRRSAGQSCPDAGRGRSGDSRTLLPLQLSSIRMLTVSWTSAVRI